jgi:hypothetical protein
MGVLPVKVLKEGKAEYIQALVDTRERYDIGLFCRCMTELHCRHLQADIDQYERSTDEEVVDKSVLKQKKVDKWSIKPTLAEPPPLTLKSKTGSGPLRAAPTP